MPPKKQDKGQQKAAEKQKQKIVEDKTFGLKNKNKSKAVQKYIRSVQAQVTGTRPKTEHEIAAEQKAASEAKKKLAAQQALLASLTKGAENIKKLNIDGSAKKNDPRSIRQDQQIDIYVDQRAQKGTKPGEETMDDWDQAKLEQVVKTKHGGQRATTDIVCKFFLDAIEKRLYGWFWQCPNGEQCQYKHCLPPGYVLKKKKVEEVEEEEEPIEEIIERKRAALPTVGTPVTLETFLAWKERKKQEAIQAAETLRKEKEKGGRTDLSGRDLFAFDPSLFIDDAQAVDSAEYIEDEEYWNTQVAAEDDQKEELLRQQRNENAGESSSEHGEEEEQADMAQKRTDLVQVGRADLFLEDDDVDPDDLE